MATPTNLTQESLFGAIARLINKKSFSDISVSELTRVAGISRPTFYRHYHNIMDILTVALASLQQDFQATVTFHDNYQYILQTILFFQHHHTTVQVLLQAGQETALQQKVATTMAELSYQKNSVAALSDLEAQYYVTYHTTGLLSVILDWINNGQPESPEALARFLNDNSRQLYKPMPKKSEEG